MIENYASAVLGLQKLVLQVGVHNRRAISLYERAGFLCVGTLKAHHFAGGRFHDVLIMEKFLRRKTR